MTTETVTKKLFDYARRNQETDSLNEFGVGAKEALGYLAGDKGKFTLKTTYSDPVSNVRTVTSIEETTLADVYDEKVGFEVRTRSAEPGEPTGTMWTIKSIKGGMNAPQQDVLFRQLGGMYRRVISIGDVVIKGEDSNGKSHVITFETPKLLRSHPMFGPTPDFEKPEVLWKVNFKFDWEPPKNLDVPGGVGLDASNACSRTRMASRLFGVEELSKWLAVHSGLPRQRSSRTQAPHLISDLLENSIVIKFQQRK
jgi:hypothetical protein